MWEVSISPALDFRGGFHSEQEIQWGNALRRTRGGRVTGGLWLCCTFCCSLKTDKSHPSLRVHCCRDILTTSQQDKDKQKPTPGAHNSGKQTYFLPAPWIYQTRLFEREERGGVQQETKTKCCRRQQGKVTPAAAGFISAWMFTQELSGSCLKDRLVPWKNELRGTGTAPSAAGAGQHQGSASPAQQLRAPAARGQSLPQPQQAQPGGRAGQV